MANKEQNRVPSVIPEDLVNVGGSFVEFIKKYYEFLNQDGMPSDIINSPSIQRDLTDAADNFLDTVHGEFGFGYPINKDSDRVNIIQNMSRIYATKGSLDSVKMLFRIMFGEEVEITLPKDYILKPSSGTWLSEYSIMADLASGDPYELIGKFAEVETNFPGSPPQTFEVEVNRVVNKGNNTYQIFFNRSFVGFFYNGSIIRLGDVKLIHKPSLSKILSIQDGGSGFRVGETFDVVSYERDNAYNDVLGIPDIYLREKITRRSRWGRRSRTYYRLIPVEYTRDITNESVDIDVRSDGTLTEQIQIETRLGTVEVTNIIRGNDKTVRVKYPNGTVTEVNEELSGYFSYVKVLDGGTGYTVPPEISITGGGNITTPAELDYTLKDGSLDEVFIDNAGAGYNDYPEVTIDAPYTAGATANSFITGDAVTSIAVVDGGFGYKYPPNVNITGDGIGARAEAVINSRGVVTAINVTDGGSGYSSAPTVTMALPTDQHNAILEPVIVDGEITSVDIVYPGYNYDLNNRRSYRVTFVRTSAVTGTVDDGVTASAKVEFDLNGSVTAVVMDTFGTNYASATAGVYIPAQNVSGGVRATATLNVDHSTGGIASLSSISTGYGYEGVDAIESGSGTPTRRASYSVEITGGVISAVEVDEAGSGYLYPELTVEDSGANPGSGARIYPIYKNGGLDEIIVLNGGTGYNVGNTGIADIPGFTVQPSLFFSYDSNGTITNVEVTDPGSGLDTPSISLYDGASTPLVTAVVYPRVYLGSILDVEISSGGSGYSCPEAVVSGFTTDPALLDVVTLNGYVTDVVISDPGSLYTPVITLISANKVTGTDAVIVPETSGGSLVGTTIVERGTNYSPRAVISVGGNVEINEVASIYPVVSSVDSSIESVEVVVRGQGYDPVRTTVTIESDQGDGAVIQAIVVPEGGSVTPNLDINWDAIADALTSLANFDPTGEGIVDTGFANEFAVFLGSLDTSVEPPRRYGDLNNSGSVSSSDALAALKALVGLTVTAEVATNVAKIQAVYPNVGELSLALSILRLAVGLDDDTPPEQIVNDWVTGIPEGGVYQRADISQSGNIDADDLQKLAYYAYYEYDQAGVHTFDGFYSQADKDNIETFLLAEGGPFQDYLNVTEVEFTNLVLASLPDFEDTSSEKLKSFLLQEDVDFPGFCRGDINNDGFIGTDDMILLMRRASGLEVEPQQLRWIDETIAEPLIGSIWNPLLQQGNGSGAKAVVRSVDVNGAITSLDFNSFGWDYPETFSSSVSPKLLSGTPATIAYSNDIVGITNPAYVDRQGFLSDIVKIHDNFYYQDYSYVIDTSVDFTDFEDIVLRSVHPAGMKVFGQQSINESIDVEVGVDEALAFHYNLLFTYSNPLELPLVDGVDSYGEAVFFDDNNDDETFAIYKDLTHTYNRGDNVDNIVQDETWYFTKDLTKDSGRGDNVDDIVQDETWYLTKDLTKESGRGDNVDDIVQDETWYFTKDLTQDTGRGDEVDNPVDDDTLIILKDLSEASGRGDRIAPERVVQDETWEFEKDLTEATNRGDRIAPERVVQDETWEFEKELTQATGRGDEVDNPVQEDYWSMGKALVDPAVLVRVETQTNFITFGLNPSANRDSKAVTGSVLGKDFIFAEDKSEFIDTIDNSRFDDVIAFYRTKLLGPELIDPTRFVDNGTYNFVNKPLVSSTSIPGSVAEMSINKPYSSPAVTAGSSVAGTNSSPYIQSGGSYFEDVFDYATDYQNF